eukprot:1208568-Amphidinium_carterae.1
MVSSAHKIRHTRFKITYKTSRPSQDIALQVWNQRRMISVGTLADVLSRKLSYCQDGCLHLYSVNRTGGPKHRARVTRVLSASRLLHCTVRSSENRRDHIQLAKERECVVNEFLHGRRNALKS